MHGTVQKYRRIIKCVDLSTDLANKQMIHERISIAEARSYYSVKYLGKKRFVMDFITVVSINSRVFVTG